MTAATTCRTCGIEYLAGARFCHSCGSPITTPAAPAEYKQVTVLFADVVHSMDIAATVGAERLREIMGGLFNRCATIVQRFGGTVDKFTGDGIMAVFGAPVALEDHAIRACLAALEIQRFEDVWLRLRIGLNSGEVVAGEIGPGSYTAVGEQVGLAQRMESVAPPGGVMLSASTARLVEDRLVLAEPELVHIKGAAEPVAARRLLRVESDERMAGRGDVGLVGRDWEMAAVRAMLERAVDGRGAVVRVVGPPGMGKSRLVREIAAMATERGVAVFTAACEAHTTEVSFHVLKALLREATAVAGLDPVAARAMVRARLPDADDEDLLLFDDLIGIADPDVVLAPIDPDARRRRLTALVKADAVGRTSPEVYVIEDAHWIDDVSESMLVEFMAVIPQTPSLVVITYRPEYRGALTGIAGGQTIALAPLSASESSALITELLGVDPSIGQLAGQIAERASGNPFFAQEIVRDLAERGVLHGQRGAYRSAEVTGEVHVPATLQAVIASRIDRLAPSAKRTLCAAAVIGSRFGADLLVELGIEPAFDDLVRAALIDQVKFTSHAEYVFHHPLIRAVAYESQLKSERAALHRRLGAAIEAREEGSADANAALIAEHLEAAGDLPAAYAWHMRAGAWSTNRNIAAAHMSWERACQIADALPADHPNQLTMRIAPRTLICGNGFRIGIPIAGPRVDELQKLCAAAGDKTSMAVAMAGLGGEHLLQGRVRAASQLASEQMALIESIGDPELTIGLSFAPINVKIAVGDGEAALRWSQAVIDLAAGDPTRGNFIVGSPLAIALASRGLTRWGLGRAGWRADFDDAIAMARRADPLSHAICVTYTYGLAIECGVLLPSQDVRRDIEAALRIAERSADDFSLGFGQYSLIAVLLHQDSRDDERALELLGRVRDMCMQGRFSVAEIPAVDMRTAFALGLRGDWDRAVPLARDALNDLFEAGHLGYFVMAAKILGELLLDRGDDDDLEEAQSVIDRLAAVPLGDDYVLRDLTLLRLRALLARARGDPAGYRGFADRYRKLATDLGFEGHMATAATMT